MKPEKVFIEHPARMPRVGDVYIATSDNGQNMTLVSYDFDLKRWTIITDEGVKVMGWDTFSWFLYNQHIVLIATL